ncbi:MAG: YebC/PmpR family DNA-binding transcriptional regulator [Dehalococcoidia bacterium]|jgi:YebC/PmpR family DNA-binding regulatory protein
MGGHSHWSQVKRQKGAADARRGQLFTKLGREITVASRQGGPDPNGNFRLRLAVQKARESNMPNDTIERAMKRGASGPDAAELIEVTYEGYGPGGVAVLIDVVTDNRNRSVSEIRATMGRAGGNLSEAGSVAWLFESKGVIAINAEDGGGEDLALTAIDAGAEDVDIQDARLEVITRAEDLEKVRLALQERGIAVESAELSKVPKTTVSLGDKEALQTLKLLDKLEELDDVQRVHSNAEFPDEVLEAYEG